MIVGKVPTESLALLKREQIREAEVYVGYALLVLGKAEQRLSDSE